MIRIPEIEIPARWVAVADAALRTVIGWHLAYMGVWALTSKWTYSWFGCFKCANWIGAPLFRMIADSWALNVMDFVLAWGLLAAGALLMVGRFVKAGAGFGIFYFLLMYVLNPPHFGHTGVNHYLFIDRNLIEAAMLVYVVLRSKEVTK